MPGWEPRSSRGCAWGWAKPNPEYDLAAWVLGKLAGADRKAFEARYPDVQDAVELILAGRLGEAQNRHNG